MAQMTPNNQGGRRASLHVDFTPMVDLAFLLISFFMLTAVLEQPKAMELSMPKQDPDVITEVSDLRTLNIIAAADGIHYYPGDAYDNMQMTSLSASGIREVIYAKQQEALKATGKTLICLIKFDNTARYDQMVDLLDEMAITSVEKYAVQDLTENERKVLNSESSK